MYHEYAIITRVLHYHFACIILRLLLFYKYNAVSLLFYAYNSVYPILYFTSLFMNDYDFVYIKYVMSFFTLRA